MQSRETGYRRKSWKNPLRGAATFYAMDSLKELRSAQDEERAHERPGQSGLTRSREEREGGRIASRLRASREPLPQFRQRDTVVVHGKVAHFVTAVIDHSQPPNQALSFEKSACAPVRAWLSFDVRRMKRNSSLVHPQPLLTRRRGDRGGGGIAPRSPRLRVNQSFDSCRCPRKDVRDSPR